MHHADGLITQIAAYWNHCIHDLEMTEKPVGSLEFFDDLDEYRFDKLRYLPQVVDFAGYRDSNFWRLVAESGLTYSGLPRVEHV